MLKNVRTLTLIVIGPSFVFFGFGFAAEGGETNPDSFAAKVVLFLLSVTPILTVHLTEWLKMLLPLSLKGNATKVANYVVNGVVAVIASLLMGNTPLSLEGIGMALFMWLMGSGVDQASINLSRRNVLKGLERASTPESLSDGAV